MTQQTVASAADLSALRLRQRSWWQESDLVRRLRRRPGAILGLTILTLLVLSAMFAPMLTPYQPLEPDPFAAFQEPSAAHWFGTDQLGRDIFTRVLYGGRVSLQVGLISVGIAASIGIVAGMLAGFYEGRLDTGIMRIIDVMLAFPNLLLALVIVATLGTGIFKVMIAVGIAAIPTYTRLVRASVLSTKQQAYIEAARTVGAFDLRIMARHILPNIFAPVLVLSTLGVATAILAGASLSFLGLGAQPPAAEWGLMLSQGRDYLRFAWWLTTFPGLAIMLAVLAINLVGDGLRDALDPRLRTL
ncbi:MAG: ABC transporter permease [Dehalococcoidia bacterium]